MSYTDNVQSFEEDLERPLNSSRPSKLSLREQLKADMDEYLANGGTMQQEPPAYNDPNDRRVRVIAQGYFA